MARKDCEVCGKHRARWLVEIRDNELRTTYKARICGICKWKLWPSPRKEKPRVIIRVIRRIRGRKAR